MIQELKCKISLHRGNMVPYHELSEEEQRRISSTKLSVFKCSACGKIMEGKL